MFPFAPLVELVAFVNTPDYAGNILNETKLLETHQEKEMKREYEQKGTCLYKHKFRGF
jgi:hypothetical protein